MADDLPTDPLVDILVRLPTSARRRFRLVCKRWRDVIDEGTPERQVRTKILVFKSKPQSSRALVFGDDHDGRRRHEWTYDSVAPGEVESTTTVHMVGTCNGLICLHESEYGSGKSDFSAITVANPITGEVLALPPIPVTWDSCRRHGLYGFGYHPTTGQYKVVHVPCRLSRRPDTVRVLTVGGSAWREIASPAMGGSYSNLCSEGVVCVDGSAYWFTSQADRVMALDLEDEGVTSFPGPPPVRPAGEVGRASWKLTSVNAKLSVAFPTYEQGVTRRVEVWVLDNGGAEQPWWSRRYTVVVGRNVRTCFIMMPHLTYGEYILSMSPDMNRLYRHKVGDCTNVDDEGTATQLLLSKGTELIMSNGEGAEGTVRTYAYVETREPLPC